MKILPTIYITLLSTTAAFAPPPSSRIFNALHSTTEAAIASTANDEVNPGDRDILVRCASGKQVERTPVWLMRQAGRYMAAFRQYSDKYPFRERAKHRQWQLRNWTGDNDGGSKCRGREKLKDAESVNFDETLPFIREILTSLAKEAEDANTSLIGFVGAPFTLAAYTIEEIIEALPSYKEDDDG
ncbi:hypothetical protein HJC23_000507 [Cyclotella cryptica]|uniref:Uroporphyrinogen decarboxylase (URO-D) domain-containing protein n=1 Tax=Cyclotella cryptica TaxID=29204 RepID=A0ABD3NR64_9STRA|eukprot:CCRYP_020134-RA/>CCRYP_020134-RA protein AED:0.27 eAED:0.27 QI:0/0/0/1/1/1/2/0/184